MNTKRKKFISLGDEIILFIFIYTTLFIFMPGCQKKTVDAIGVPSFSTNPENTENMKKYWPITLTQTLDMRVSDQFNLGEKAELEAMAQKWNDVQTERAYFIRPLAQTMGTNYTNLLYFEDSVNGIYYSDAWFSDVSSQALAITQFFAREKSGHYEIYHADIIYNRKYFTFSLEPNYGEYDFGSVALHEMGHFLGLSHVSIENESIMNPTLSDSEVKKDIFAIDESNIHDLYPITSGEARKLDDHGHSLAYPENGVRPKKIRGVIEIFAGQKHCKTTFFKN